MGRRQYEITDKGPAGAPCVAFAQAPVMSVPVLDEVGVLRRQFPDNDGLLQIETAKDHGMT
jgi:hypothetical protein